MTEHPIHDQDTITKTDFVVETPGGMLIGKLSQTFPEAIRMAYDELEERDVAHLTLYKLVVVKIPLLRLEK